MEVSVDNTYELVDRYIAEVGRNLPRKKRDDIEAEILSAIEDMLRERSRQAGKLIDEDMISQVLMEFGPPEKVAAAYRPETYLIEPRLFSSFNTVLQVVLLVVSVTTMVNMCIQLGQISFSVKGFSQILLSGIGGLIINGLTALGSVVVLFTIVQRIMPSKQPLKEQWNPSSLPPSGQHDRVEIGINTIEILISAAAVVIFNFFTHNINIGFFPSGRWWIAFLASENGSAWSTTILSEAFFHYLPALTILWMVTITLNLVILSRGRWENWSRWIAFGTRSSFLVLSGIMLAGPALVAVDQGILLAAGFPDLIQGALFLNFANQVANGMVILTILYNLSSSLRLLIRLTGRNLTPGLKRFSHP